MFEETDKQIKPIIVFVAIGIILIAVWIYVYWTGKNSATIPLPSGTIIDKNVVRELPSDSKLDAFPADIPVPKSANVLRKFETTLPNGRVQLTQILSSPKSVEENYGFYSDWLGNSNSWKLVSKIDDASQPALKILFAQASGKTLNITVKTDSDPKLTVIDLSVVITP